MFKIAVVLLCSLLLTVSREDRKRSSCDVGICAPGKTVFCGSAGNISCVDGGTIVSVDPNRIELTNFAGSDVAYLHDRCTKVWKGKTLFSFSALRKGDVVYTHFHCNPDGNRIVEELWTNPDKSAAP